MLSCVSVLTLPLSPPRPIGHISASLPCPYTTFQGTGRDLWPQGWAGIGQKCMEKTQTAPGVLLLFQRASCGDGKLETYFQETVGLRHLPVPDLGSRWWAGSGACCCTRMELLELMCGKWPLINQQQLHSHQSLKSSGTEYGAVGFQGDLFLG